MLGIKVDNRLEVMTFLGELEPPVRGHGTDVEPARLDLAQAVKRALVPENTATGEVQTEPDNHHHGDDRATRPAQRRGGSNADQGQCPGQEAPDIDPARPEAGRLAVEPAELAQDDQEK